MNSGSTPDPASICYNTKKQMLLWWNGYHNSLRNYCSGFESWWEHRWKQNISPRWNDNRHSHNAILELLFWVRILVGAQMKTEIKAKSGSFRLGFCLYLFFQSNIILTETEFLFCLIVPGSEFNLSNEQKKLQSF